MGPRDIVRACDIDTDVRPQLLARLERARAAPREDSIEHALLALDEDYEAPPDDDEPTMEVGVRPESASLNDNRWSNAVELEGDGVLEIHSPSVVDLDELDAEWF